MKSKYNADEIRDIALRHLYGTKSLSIKNVDCFVQGYKKAITEETDTQYLQRIGEYWHKQYRKDEDEAAQYSGSFLHGKRLQKVLACEAASKLILEAVEILKNGGVV